jgi:hypothetical protein
LRLLAVDIYHAKFDRRLRGDDNGAATPAR